MEVVSVVKQDQNSRQLPHSYRYTILTKLAGEPWRIGIRAELEHMVYNAHPRQTHNMD